MTCGCLVSFASGVVPPSKALRTSRYVTFPLEARRICMYLRTREASKFIAKVVAIAVGDWYDFLVERGQLSKKDAYIRDQ